MVTLALAAAGSAVGGAIGGTVLGIGAAAIGQAVGATLGGVVDQMIFGRGASVVEGPRLESLRVQNSTEGAPIPRVFGRMRVAGTVIWATKFRETVDESRQGGKGGGGGGTTVRQYRYSISFALALCEGEILRTGRIWADGKLLNTDTLTYRVHRGTPDQQPDGLIEAVEGVNVPAFRGTAYIVFENMELGAYGNRIPQLNVEVIRTVSPLHKLIKGVALSPGSGEFSLATEPVRLVVREGVTTTENIHTPSGQVNVIESLDQLQAEAQNCESVALIVSWFGSDLRCSECRIVPKVESTTRDTEPLVWGVNGLTRSMAEAVGRDAENRPVYGGTPSDETVIQTIREIKRRGLKVMFYPFILMDIPGGNGKPDPYGGEEQVPYPWRGRITLANSNDQQTPAATAQVNAFHDGEWGLRRFVRHYADLCAQAGGVEAFCIGSELRGLTQIRDTKTHYPFVDKLRTLAAEVRSILPHTKLGYAADWSEYYGHYDAGDLFFHLDPLWADDNIDFIGIDNYMPLSDARNSSEYNIQSLKANIEGGEGYDWYYASQAARDAQDRTPIIDTAHGEHWVFRYKDIRNWWSQPHYNRPNGVREAIPTSWVPQSKPIWFTEVGCPAVDKGANQPNVFYDPKSSESALPYYARGQRDDFQQARFLEAILDYWQHVNPVSSVYNDTMINVARTHVWTWDARPWPAFPGLKNIWSDAPNYEFGHWISGRLSLNALADVVAAICAQSGVTQVDVSRLHSMIEGFTMPRAQTARAALQELMLVYGFDGYESGGVLRFLHRGHAPTITLEEITQASQSREQARDVTTRVRLGYIDSGDYEVAAREAISPVQQTASVSSTAVNLIMGGAAAQYTVERMLWEATTSRESLRGMVPLSLLRLEPSDIIVLNGEAFRIDTLSLGGMRQLEATKVGGGLHTQRPGLLPITITPPVAPPAPLVAVFMDLPLLNEVDPKLRIALFADPWPGEAVMMREDNEAAYVHRPSVIGRLTNTLKTAFAGRWWRGSATVSLAGGALESRERLSVLNGANVAVLETPDGWEVIQFQTAELIAARTYRITDILRGQAGTEHLVQDLPVGTRFVLLNGTNATLPMETLERAYLYGASNLPVSHPSFQSVRKAFDGVGYRPYSVAHLRVRLENETLHIRWIRRTRLNGDNWQGIDPPLGEDQELYHVRIIKEGTLRRETLVSQPSAIIMLDGLTPPFDISVSQLSALYGAGTTKSITFYG